MSTFTNSTTSIPLDFPNTWDPSDLTGLTIQIADVEGNELIASSAATLYSETTLDSAVSRYSTSIVLADGSDSLSDGDQIRISGVLGYEDHVVKGWSLSDLTATLEDFVDRDFEAGATVNRLYAVATVDLSDTDVFQSGDMIVITWTPTGTGAPLTQIAEIEEYSQIDVAGFVGDFRALYSRAYKALTSPEGRLDTVIRLSQDELRTDLASRGLDISRIKDQRLISPPLMAKVAEIWARDGDKDSDDEHQRHSRTYSAALETLCSLPIWVDLDGDGAQEDGEIDTYPVILEEVW
jgi:hypothetical protein